MTMKLQRDSLTGRLLINPSGKLQGECCCSGDAWDYRCLPCIREGALHDIYYLTMDFGGECAGDFPLTQILHFQLPHQTDLCTWLSEDSLMIMTYVTPVLPGQTQWWYIGPNGNVCAPSIVPVTFTDPCSPPDAFALSVLYSIPCPAGCGGKIRTGVLTW